MANNNKNKGGRPTKPEEDKITEYINLGFTKKQMALIDASAEEAGYKQRARFLRSMYLRLLVEGKVVFVRQSEVNDQLANDVNGVSNNLNQATHKIHETDRDEGYDDLSIQILQLQPLLQLVIKELRNGRRVQS